ncbi:MAG TPA: SDR family oxidoreductase [Verrucomicrobiae bacterium]|nr:SDR family oxidoreductase [Verrucomicrobiae bacterium]
MKRETALITGASSGIGLALATEFARNGHALVLTAPHHDQLEKVAAQITKQHDVEVAIIEKDLTKPDAAEQIFRELRAAHTSVGILVNDAGIGQHGRFAETPIERDIAIVRLNIEATLRLTKLFLQNLQTHRDARILNVASIAGFEPGPLLAVYHASKAFVLSFSEALAIELEDTEITVTALCPGATDTDFFRKADMTETRIYKKGKLMPADTVAAGAYQALLRGDSIYVPGPANKVLVFVRRLTSAPLQARMNQRFYEEVGSHEKRKEKEYVSR